MKITGKVILGEIIGGTNLHNPALKNDNSMHPFVVVMKLKKKKLKGESSEEVLLQTKECKETNNPIWCINHRCLFLCTTPDTEDDIDSSELQFDVRDKSDLLVTNPLDCTLIGSCKMSLRDIVDACLKMPEGRIELQLESATQRAIYSMFSKPNFSKNDEPEDVNKIAIRFRFATDFDKNFMEKFGKMKGTFASYLYYIGNTPGALTMKTAEKAVYFTNKTVPMMDEIAEPINKNVITQKEIKVQPGPDPDRPKSTKYLSHEQMKIENQKPSTNWTQFGSVRKDEDLGELYLEILNCDKLPNTDAPDGILGFGYKTDAFVCAIYDEFFAQTDVIENRLSPMWMPWTQRSFCFAIKHPFSQLFLSVNDFNSVTKFVCIGRIQVNLNHFEPDVTYTLKYKLHPASNVNVREVSCILFENML